MNKIFNIILIFLVLIFFWSIYLYYSSNTNLSDKAFNRNNIEQMINKKIINLPVLTNDTNNVIEFNNSISEETNNNKTRSFWKLLKSK